MQFHHYVNFKRQAQQISFPLCHVQILKELREERINTSDAFANILSFKCQRNETNNTKVNFIRIRDEKR